MVTSQGSTRATVLLGVVAVLFAAAIVQLVVAAFSRREAPTYDITPVAPVERTFERFSDTVTVDARDETRWAFFDFERRSTVVAPDTVAWDIAFRRFDVIAAKGVLNMGKVPLDSIVRVPNDEFVQTTWGSDTVNTELQTWYDYSFTTHLLTPEGNVFVIQTTEGGSVKLQLLGYYCPGMVAGCVTFRYEYAPPDAPVFADRNGP